VHPKRRVLADNVIKCERQHNQYDPKRIFEHRQAIV
jgi:hypothetical protein